MTWSVILVNLVIPAVTALLGGAGVHLWHTKGVATTTPNTPARSTPPPPPLPIPDTLFAKHPLLSHLAATYGDELEADLLNQFKAKLGLGGATAPTAATAPPTK